MIIRSATIADLKELRKLSTRIFEEVNRMCDDDVVSIFTEIDGSKVDCPQG